MSDLLFLASRIPYPPDKGEKIRGWHMLERLARSHRLHVGAFIDDPADFGHVEHVRRVAGGEVRFVPLRPLPARLRALRALAGGGSLSCAVFQSTELERWIDRVLRDHPIGGTYVLSSAMAGYVMRRPALRRAPAILDMVDVDSDKYRQYAGQARAPMRWIYAREAGRLSRHERAAALWFDSTLLVAPHETALFAGMAPESRLRIRTVPNGVDVDHFDPARRSPNPYPPHAQAIVFTGRMDYAPNQDAAEWFVRAVLPLIATRHPGVGFWIVGANPAPRVRRLAALPGVTVTGRVDDVRPYLAHAAVAVAPLRLARGVQNKVLEAMAMARPVVATSAATQALAVRPGHDLLVADDAPALAEAVLQALAPAVGAALGTAARAYVVAAHRWEDALLPIDQLLGARDAPVHA